MLSNSQDHAVLGVARLCFQFGKLKLIEVSSQVPGNTSHNNAPSEQEMRKAIAKNSKIKANYESLILEIGKSFRDQIRG